jgi:hypothetical protein
MKVYPQFLTGTLVAKTSLPHNSTVERTSKIRSSRLSEQEKKDLVDFMRAL